MDQHVGVAILTSFVFQSVNICSFYFSLADGYLSGDPCFEMGRQLNEVYRTLLFQVLETLQRRAFIIYKSAT